MPLEQINRALEALRSATTELEQAKAIYEQEEGVEKEPAAMTDEELGSAINNPQVPGQKKMMAPGMPRGI